ncbi:homoserine kinase [Sporosarcina sp. Marseille-Q4063]|uniref:homoserine kinase n=1 Tax=Sporosarcina sp. Marseille-Q4063 TaxID=2810514 RepID=UPI001BAF5172|nr:homoserine kinase [Sporosarcina sp. Marseille-Q4063]QUW20659.1 homoserine kinase [Sporosarcina sp. Marseille-Q4063]
MNMPGFSVVVPASTANLGPGFDSVGLALGLYMTVNVSSHALWKVSYNNEEYNGIPNDEQNLIVKTVMNVAEKYGKKPPTLLLNVDSEIPLGKGFGSSATAIAAGIEIANQVLELGLADREKVMVGSQIEGHADNVSAALLGGAVVSYFDGESIDYIHIEKPTVGIVVLVPPKVLPTEDSRNLLPAQLSHKEATRNSASACVLSAALATNNWETIGRMMEKDGFHEPHRKHLFPSFEEIRQSSKELGAYGMTISGAGPSLFVAVPIGKEDVIANELAKRYPFYKSIITQPSEAGSIVN